MSRNYSEYNISKRKESARSGLVLNLNCSIQLLCHYWKQENGLFFRYHFVYQAFCLSSEKVILFGNYGYEFTIDIHFQRAHLIKINITTSAFSFRQSDLGHSNLIGVLSHSRKYKKVIHPDIQLAWIWHYSIYFPEHTYLSIN